MVKRSLQAFLSSFQKYLLSACYFMNIVLGTKNMVLEMVEITPAFRQLKSNGITQ
jgi:hypothetical protein